MPEQVNASFCSVVQCEAGCFLEFLAKRKINVCPHNSVIETVSEIRSVIGQMWKNRRQDVQIEMLRQSVQTHISGI